MAVRPHYRHPQRRPITKQRQQCPHCRTLLTDAPPAGWVLHLLCRAHSTGLARTWGQASPRASHSAQLLPKPGSRGSTSLEDMGAAEEWPRRGLAMGLTPKEFEALQILLRAAFDAVGRTAWRRAFMPTERRLFTQSQPDLAVWDGSPARAAATDSAPEPENEPATREEITLSFASFASLVRGKMGRSACPDEMLVRMWLLLDALPPRGQVTWTELTHAVRQCPLYKAEPAQPRVPHSDALPMPPWSKGQRVYVPQCGMGTVIKLGRMAGDVRVAIDAADCATRTLVWRRREDVARIVTDPDQAVQALTSPTAQALRLLLRQSKDVCSAPTSRRRGERKTSKGPGASMWATSPLYLQSSADSNRRQGAATMKQPRREDRVREHIVNGGASPVTAERLEREQEAAALKLYRTSRLYKVIGDIDADDGCSPRTWWFNERQRRAAAQKKAQLDRIKKSEAAATAALAEDQGDEADTFKSPYASSQVTATCAVRRQKRLRGGGRVLLPPSRTKSPPVAAPRLSHLIPKGPLLWDPVRGFDESESLQYPVPAINSSHSTPLAVGSERAS